MLAQIVRLNIVGWQVEVVRDVFLDEVDVGPSGYRQHSSDIVF